MKGHSLFAKSEQDYGIFIPEQFSEEQKMIKDMTAEFAQHDILPVLNEIEKKNFLLTKKLIKQSGELGLIRAGIREQDGGLDLGKISETIIAENMGVTRSFSITFGGQTGIGALPIAYFGNEEQKKKYLPGLLSGEKIAAYALTEPDSGTDALSLKATAFLTEDKENYVLNGEKQWITNSALAHIFIVYAKVDTDKLTAFIVEKDSCRLSIGPEEDKMGLHGSSTCSLILDNVKVPRENVIGDIGRGHVIALNVLNIGRLKIATSALGLAKRAIELAVKYGNKRQQFKTPISQFNLIKEKIAQMTVRAFATESSIYRTSGVMEEAFDKRIASGSSYAEVISSFVIECSLNKIFATETLDFIIDEAVQIHGGYGYMSEYEVEAIYRDSRINRIFEGTNEINRIVITNTIFRESRFNVHSINEDINYLKRENSLLTRLVEIYVTLVKIIKSDKTIQLNSDQELASYIANLVTAIYSIESTILRTEKIIEIGGLHEAEHAINCTKVYVYEQVIKKITNIFSFLNYLNNDYRIITIVHKLFEQLADTENLVYLKRTIANRIISEESYKI